MRSGPAGCLHLLHGNGHQPPRDRYSGGMDDGYRRKETSPTCCGMVQSSHTAAKSVAPSSRQVAHLAHLTASSVQHLGSATTDKTSQNHMAQPQDLPRAKVSPGPWASSPFQDTFEAAQASSGPRHACLSQASGIPPTPDSHPAGAVCEGWVAFGLWEDVTSRDCPCPSAEAEPCATFPASTAFPMAIPPGNEESGEADWAISWDDPTFPLAHAPSTCTEPDDGIDWASIWDEPAALPVNAASDQQQDDDGSGDIDWATIWDGLAPPAARPHYTTRKPAGLCIDLNAPLAPPSAHARLRTGMAYTRLKMAFCEQRMMLQGRPDSFIEPAAPYSYLMGPQDVLKPAPASQGSRKKRCSNLQAAMKAIEATTYDGRRDVL
ncbi:hypothetical protein WJX74_001416 [Apatococcus lobatus]|uniref:Uncharacterized protein n=1 Tax=Apatococcus lobatus TaxID=904363 RepID=A0AAW1RYL9_9CHLO